MESSQAATQRIAEQKRVLRGILRRRRGALSETQRRDASARIHKRILDLSSLQSAGSVFCFLSTPGEVDTHALVAALIERGKRVSIPWFAPGKEMFAVPFPGWAELAPGPLGILAPRAPGAPVDAVEICITPGLGFTARGERIGYGRGYYDGWFAAHPSCARVGIAFDCQLIDRIPTGPTDLCVHQVITESRFIDAGAAPAA